MEASHTGNTSATTRIRRTRIVESLHKAYQETEELLSLVRGECQIADREELILDIHLRLDRRDRLLSSINPPFSEEETLLGKQIIQWNQEIVIKFEEIKKQIQFDISNLQKAKRTSVNYMNQLSYSSPDGMYYDKRK